MGRDGKIYAPVSGVLENGIFLQKGLDRILLFRPTEQIACRFGDHLPPMA
jgi:hypothetical protein